MPTNEAPFRRLSKKDLDDPELLQLNYILGRLVSELAGITGVHGVSEFSADLVAPRAEIKDLSVPTKKGALLSLAAATKLFGAAAQQPRAAVSSGSGIVIEYGTQAQLPTLLEAKDAGYLYCVTDYNHLLRWTGAGWTWGPGDPGSNYWVFAPERPGDGWVLMNGTPITYLKSNGTLGTHVSADMTDGRYARGAALFSGAHVEPTNVVVGTQVVASGTGATVASATHTHDPGEPKKVMDWLPYFRI